MIVVDTSVFIDFFKGTNNRESDLLDHFLQKDLVIIGDIVAMELTMGVKSN